MQDEGVGAPGMDGRRPGEAALAVGSGPPEHEAAGKHIFSQRRSPTTGAIRGPPHIRWMPSNRPGLRTALGNRG